MTSGGMKRSSRAYFPLMSETDFAGFDTLEKWCHLSRLIHMKKYRNDVESIGHWDNIKELYAAHRDELANTYGWAEHKALLEGIFTDEIDQALRAIFEQET
jgi:hypothetical protein